MGMKRLAAVLFAAAAFFGAVSSACSDPSLAKILMPTRIYRVTKPFTDDGGGVAMNISGLAWGAMLDGRHVW
jgi:hypothetical protein